MWGDKKQGEKDNLSRMLTNLDKKIATSKDKAKVWKVKCIRVQAKQMYRDLGEKYVEVEELLKLEQKIAMMTNRSELTELKGM